MAAIPMAAGESSSASTLTPPDISAPKIDWVNYYSGIGFHTFPVLAGHKAPPLVAFSTEATTDRDQLYAWFGDPARDKKFLNANIALAARQSCLVIADVDTKEGKVGIPWLTARAEEHGDNDFLTMRQRTPSNGHHFLYLVTREISEELSISAGDDNNGLAPGVDIRAGNGYIVLAPSVLVPDPKKPGTVPGRYEWIHGHDKIKPLPLWLLEEIRALKVRSSQPKAKAPSSKSTGKQIDHSNDARNNTLAKEAGRLRRQGFGFETLLGCLALINKEWYSTHKEGLLPVKELEAMAKHAVAKYEPSPDAPPEVHIVYNAAELLTREIMPMKWMIENIVPGDGVTMLTDRPKKGKSWLALQAAVAIADGKPFLGRFKTNQSRVLFYALEDGERRMQSRLGHVPNFDLTNLDFTHKLTLNAEGITALMKVLSDAVEAGCPYGLIVIDTFLKAQPQRKANTDTVRSDYAEIATLKEICDKFQLGILVVHHSRKLGKGDDPSSVDSILGTTGVSASVDAIVMLATTSDGDRIMCVTGKDAGLDDAQAMTFDMEASPPWTCQGSAFWLQISEEREKIIDYLATNGPARTSEIAKDIGGKKNAVNQMLKRMAKDMLVERGADERWKLTALAEEALRQKDGAAGELDFNAITDVMAAKGVM